MSLFKRLRQLRHAQDRMVQARQALGVPAAQLLARGHRHPLSTVGIAAGAGFMLGQLNVHPLRLPGVGPLVGSGLAEAVAYGSKFIAELGPGAVSTGSADPTSPTVTATSDSTS